MSIGPQYQSESAGFEWLHVDFEDHRRPFYFDSSKRIAAVRKNRSPQWSEPDTRSRYLPPTTDTVSTAESFFTAFLRGDWDAANNLAQRVLISGENANLLWEIDVVSIDCELVTEFLISCTSTQTDALTRQVGTAYACQPVGTMLLVDGVVTWYTSENQSVSFQGWYEAWLDDESPDGWLFSECTHGGYLAARCLPIYLANVEAWLATDPDLSDIEG